jgi:hypothetical protein
MKFYTAEMVNRWNGDVLGTNKEVYDREWDETQDQYERHYARLADSFPASVRRFNEIAVLHNESIVALPRTSDAEGRVVGYQRDADYTVVTVSRVDQMVHVLTYLLEKPPTVRIHDSGGFDPPENAAVWLYDEFDVDDAGLFIHRILFSNGVELTVTFKTLNWYECSINEEG